MITVLEVSISAAEAVDIKHWFSTMGGGAGAVVKTPLWGLEGPFTGVDNQALWSESQQYEELY